MPSQSDLVYRSRETIVTEMIAALQARIPDAQTGPDSVWRIIIEVVANSIDGLYLAAFLLNQDLYVQTAEYESLLRRGEEFGLGMKLGTPATGTVAISGDGGTVIPLGTQVGAPQVSGSALLFNTTVLATIPNPGAPTAPVAADALVAGNLTGLYEWAVTFVTLAGETQVGASSNALTLTASRASLTAIPVGGPGTTARKLYRSLNGGLFQYTATLNNNTATFTLTTPRTERLAGSRHLTVQLKLSLLPSSQTRTAPTTIFRLERSLRLPTTQTRPGSRPLSTIARRRVDLTQSRWSSIGSTFLTSYATRSRDLLLTWRCGLKP
jgi:hypothetical protein